MTRQKCIIAELDGCLADNSHRLHWFMKPKCRNNWCRVEKDNLTGLMSQFGCASCDNWQPDWEKYHEEMKNDKVNDAINSLISACTDCIIIFVTQRPDKFRKLTIEWFEKYDMFCFPNVPMLFMRPDYLSCDFGRSLVLDKTIRNFCEKCFLESGGIYAKKQLPTAITVQGKCQDCGTERLVIPVTLGLPAPDTRPEHEVKREIYEREIQPHYDVMFVLEADDDCTRMYQELGLQVLKVMGRN